MRWFGHLWDALQRPVSEPAPPEAWRTASGVLTAEESLGLFDVQYQVKDLAGNVIGDMFSETFAFPETYIKRVRMEALKPVVCDYLSRKHGGLLVALRRDYENGSYKDRFHFRGYVIAGKDPEA